MRLPRAGVRTLLIIVAIMTILFAMIVHVSRWSDRGKTVLYEKICGYLFFIILMGLGELVEQRWLSRRASRRRINSQVHPMWDSWNDGLPR